MARLFLIAVLLAANALAARLPDIEGTWTAGLNAGLINLNLTLHLSKNGKGTLDSPDLGAVASPVTDVHLVDFKITFRVPAANASFAGVLIRENQRMDGVWTQGFALPLVFNREGVTTQHRRPQTPQPPFPYNESDVLFPSMARNVVLAGTLSVPKGRGPFPAVLLITGSGPQDRDETILDHKPFAVMADHLTRAGIAVLRVDDRGTGQSTGRFAGATTKDFALDAEGAVRYLQTRAYINRVGLIGHSEGGLIAPMVANAMPGISFVILLAAPGVPGDQIVLEQQMLISRALGIPESLLAASRERQMKILTIARTEGDPALARSKMRAALGQFSMPVLNAMDRQFDEATTPWFRYLINYDPGPALRDLKQPVLAINGSLDLQVSPEQNLPAIAWELEAGRNKDYQIVKMAGLNHLLQTAKTGAPNEYGEIEETISPSVLEQITLWIGQHTR